MSGSTLNEFAVEFKHSNVKSFGDVHPIVGLRDPATPQVILFED